MQTLRLGLLGLLWCMASYAAPCGSATLLTYIGFAATGCSVGPFTFHDFSFSVLSSTGGPATIGAADINVTVVTGPSKYGLNYASSGYNLTAGQSVNYLLTYTVDPPPPIIWGMELDMITNTPVAPGTATVTSVECVGAAFVGSVCGTSTVTNTVFHNGGTSFHLTDVEPIPATTTIGDRTTIVLDATSGGSSSFTSFTEAVLIPEPGTLGLSGLALGLVLLRRRRAG